MLASNLLLKHNGYSIAAARALPGQTAEGNVCEAQLERVLVFPAAPWKLLSWNLMYKWRETEVSGFSCFQMV